MKVYIASPFFNEFEKLVRDMMVNTVNEMGYEVFSPSSTKSSKEYGKCTGPERRKELAVKIFSENILNLNECDYLIFPKFTTDLGTLFEVGYFMALGKPILRFNYLSQKIEKPEYRKLGKVVMDFRYFTLFTDRDAVMFGYFYGQGEQDLKYYLPDGRRDNIMFSSNFDRVDVDGHVIFKRWEEVD